MAPFPQFITTSISTRSDSEAPSSTLPGLKRGIAVGVASSVCLILIALLAAFVVRRRKQRKAQKQQHVHPSDVKELPDTSNEKGAPPLPEKDWISILPSPVEADTHIIYELEAGQVPELPSHAPGIPELDCENTGGRVKDLGQPGPIVKDESVEARVMCEPRYRDVPTLCISPPEMSPLSSSSLLGISPLSVSPLEEAYFPQSPRSPRSPHSPLSPQNPQLQQWI